MKDRHLLVSTVPEHGMKTEDFAMAQTAASRVFGRDGHAGVIFEGNSAYVRTDGAIVYPALASGHQMTKEEVLVARGFADHETAHKRYTDMKQTGAFMKRCERSDNKKLAMVANAIDDLRVEQLAVRDYSGAKANLEATSESVFQEYLEFAKEDPEQAKDMDVVLPLMLTAEGKRQLGYRCPSAEAALNVISAEDRAFIEKVTKAALQCRNPDPVKGTREVIKVAKAVVKELEEREEKEEPPEPLGGEGGSGDGESPAPMPSEGETSPSEESKERLEEGVSSGSPPPPTLEDLAQRAMTRSFEKYIEANTEHYRPYSTEFDRYSRYGDGSPIGDYMKRSCPGARQYESVVHEMRGKISTMSRKLERALLSVQRRDWRTNTEFGGLDPKRLVQASMGKANVFRLRDDRKELDTAVSMMIDLSGSMKGGKASLAMKVAIALALVLERTGVAYEVLGWNNYFMHNDGHKTNTQPGVAAFDFISPNWRTQAKEAYMAGGRFSRLEPLQVYEFKGFDKRLSQERDGMGSISRCAGGHNSDVDAVRLAARHLRARTEQRKILFVLSDGLPECSCSLGVTHQHQHLRNAVGECGKQGIECVGIGIMSEAVRRFYPDYVVVYDLDDLPKAAFDQMAKLLVGQRFKVDNSELMAASGAR